MAITLAEAQKRRQNPLELAIVKTFEENWPILRNSQIAAIDGNALTFNREGTLPAPAFRAVNGSVSATNQVVNQTTIPLKILANKLQIDQFLNATTPNMASQELRAQIKGIALDGNKAVFKGDSGTNALECDGLQKQTTDLSTVIDNGTAALKLTNLRKLIVETKGTNKALYMSQDMYLHFWNASEDPTISNVSRTADQFGREQLFFGGVPVNMVGEDTDGNDILPFEEGAGTNETSIYCVAHDMGFRFLNNTNGTDIQDEFGIRVRPKSDGDFAKEWEFEWYFAPTIWEKNGVYRLSGITDGAITKS